MLRGPRSLSDTTAANRLSGERARSWRPGAADAPFGSVANVERRVLWLATRMIDHANRERPRPDLVEHYVPPGGAGIRMETHLYSGYDVPPYYDSLLGKLIVCGLHFADETGIDGHLTPGHTPGIDHFRVINYLDRPVPVRCMGIQSDCLPDKTTGNIPDTFRKLPIGINFSFTGKWLQGLYICLF